MIDLSLAYEITPQWLAGFFDGEGTVGLYKGLEVKLTQKDPTVLILIASKFKNACWSKSTKACDIRFYDINCKEFLEFVLPYVIVKRTQVEIALKYLDNKLSKSNASLLLQSEKQYNHLN